MLAYSRVVHLVEPLEELSEQVVALGGGQADIVSDANLYFPRFAGDYALAHFKVRHNPAVDAFHPIGV